MLIKDSSTQIVLSNYTSNSCIFTIKLYPSNSNEILNKVDEWNNNFINELSKISYNKNNFELTWIFEPALIFVRIENFIDYFSKYIPVKKSLTIPNFDLIYEILDESGMGSTFKFKTNKRRINSGNEYEKIVTFLHDSGNVLAEIKDGEWNYNGNLKSYDISIEMLNDTIINTVHNVMLSKNNFNVQNGSNESIFIEELLSYMLEKISFSLRDGCYLFPLKYKWLREFSDKLKTLGIINKDTIDLRKFINLYNICLTDDRIKIIPFEKLDKKSDEDEFPLISLQGNSFMELFNIFHNLFLIINN